jgi:hypothetical protein
MTDRPILFSAPMVRAILAGTKTQTRRVVKLKPWQQIEERDDGTPWPWMYDDDRADDHWLPCPYGQAGDRLWVREAWRVVWSSDNEPPRELDAAYRFWYEADAPLQDGYGKLRPSIHMPRFASRITLEITAVRVERLQQIDEADARAEGICRTECPDWHATTDYRALWESINGPGSWDANPWVWVIEFKRVGGGNG